MAAPSNENPSKLPIFFGILLIVIIIAGGLTFWLKGGAGFFTFLKWFGIVLGVIAIFGGIVFAFMWLFSTQPSDAIFLNRQRYLKACELNKPSFPQDIYFKGSDEWEYKKIGKIVGVCQSKIVKIIPNSFTESEKEIIDEKTGEKRIVKFQKPKTEELIEDVISFKRGGWFSPIEMVRVVRTERTSLNSDKVFLKAMAFTPELFGFYYLSPRYRDKDMIDRVIADEIHRGTLQHILKEEENIVDDAIAISPRHQKEIERNRLQLIQGGNASQAAGNSPT